MASTERLVLGVDGGGTKTVAWLAEVEPSGKESTIGRGAAGPSNPQAVGLNAALHQIDKAVDAAFARASESPGPVASACVALSGADRQSVQTALGRWADRRRLTHAFRVVHDAVPVLAAGTPAGWGIALIAGTGSLAFGCDARGRSARAGGWGPLFGDEGSGYAVALAALRAAAQAADGRGPATQLLARILTRLDLQQPLDLIPFLYNEPLDHAAISTLGSVVFEVLEEGGDEAAERIVAEAAEELARMAQALAPRLGFFNHPFPLGLAGGFLLHHPPLQERLLDSLRRRGLNPDPVGCVDEPVAGAVQIARAMAKRDSSAS